MDTSLQSLTYLSSDQELVAAYKIIVQGAKWYKRILEKIQTTTSQQQRRHQWRSGDGVSEQNWCKQCQHDPAGGDCHSECGHWRWWERSELQCSVQRLALLKIAWRRHYTLGMKFVTSKAVLQFQNNFWWYFYNFSTIYRIKYLQNLCTLTSLTVSLQSLSAKNASVRGKLDWWIYGLGFWLLPTVSFILARIVFRVSFCWSF